MNWWQETEARALRRATPVGVGQLFWQRLRAAGIDQDLAFVPAYDLAQLFDLCADLVKLTDSLLSLADGDGDGLRRHALLLDRWADYALTWTQVSADHFNRLLDSLQLEAEELAAREAVQPDEAAEPPEAEPKVGGRYQDWHLLYERLDLKLASGGLAERQHRGLARAIARLYEAALDTMRQLHQLEKEQNPRFGPVSRLLLAINTSWHFDLGPYHLGYGRLQAHGAALPGLKYWLLSM
ncbi:MAG: hypothetical protein ACM3XM_21450 [Mycobacterium leprae]